MPDILIHRHGSVLNTVLLKGGRVQSHLPITGDEGRYVVAYCSRRPDRLKTLFHEHAYVLVLGGGKIYSTFAEELDKFN